MIHREPLQDCRRYEAVQQQHSSASVPLGLCCASDTVEQARDEHRIGPPMRLLSNCLRRRARRKNLTTSVIKSKTGHLDAVGEESPTVGEVMRFEAGSNCTDSPYASITG